MFIVYKITNKVNHKIYIGSTSKSLVERFKKHINDAKNTDYPLYLDIIEYGPDSFEIQLIEECANKSEMLSREIFWIKYLKSNTINGNYNIKYGKCIGPYNVNYDLIEDIKTSLNGRKIKWLSKMSGICKTRISRLLRGYGEFEPNELNKINKVLGTDFKL